jgi:hypothetical protein
MITTPASAKFPLIEWDITNELLEKDIDERMEVYVAHGEDKKGNQYSGSAYYFCDELDEIKDIELTWDKTWETMKELNNLEAKGYFDKELYK